MSGGFDPTLLTIKDAQRLQRQIERAQQSRKPLDAARFAQELAQAQSRLATRALLKPAVLHFPEELPISQARETLAAAITANQVVVICGETGSGKTTQLPKICLELGRGVRGLIGHTQPRRLAARSVATRIAQEVGCTLGDLVGFETRFDKRVSERTLIKLMTDGILLAELSHDRELLAYDTIIIDEAHERSLNIDFLLGWLKRLAPRRPDLKIIITSATLDPERLSAHFNGAPIHTVSGRTYPVDHYYAPPEENTDIEDAVANGIDTLWGTRAPDGDILVFLPGEREINDCTRVLGGRFPRAAVLPLYSRLPAAQQDKVFSTGGPPRIVLATNVAETSVTVPGIRYVIDVGTARMSRFNPRSGVQSLQIEPVSQAAANQRAGRCGRLGPGICLRLYAEDDFAARPVFTDPEILRSNLAGVILQMASLGLGDVDAFPWVQPPESRHVSEGYRVLQVVGALDEDRRLTPFGRQLARLPLDPRIARIALAGKGERHEREVFALAAALSVQDPHENPLEAQTQARQKHAEWKNLKSDFLTLLALWRLWQEVSGHMNQNALRKWCKAHYVSYLRMEEWTQVYKQVVDFLADDKSAKPAGALQTLDELYVPVHKALLTGLIDHIGVKAPEKPDYGGPRGRRFKIFPGSALAKKGPQWVMHAAIVHTSQVFARTCAAIEPEWLVDVGAHLIKRALQHPEWDSQRGEVTALEHLSLFGIPLLKRARHFGSEDPIAARTIFIREGLVRGEILGKPDFLKKNLALIETVREKEARLRRPDLLADEAQLFAFYDARLPLDVCTVAGLKQWVHLRARSGDRGRGTGHGASALPALAVARSSASTPATLSDLRQALAPSRPIPHSPFPNPASPLLMEEADVLRPGANADVENRFPDQLTLAGVKVSLSYEHDPGADEDGVSFHLPLAQLFAFDADVFDWLVPGLLVGKIEALIKTLPNHLRRLCQPAAQYAEAIAESAPPKGPLIDAICTRFKAMTGVELQPADFAPDKLPAHFKPRLVAEDAQGKVLGEAETLADLRAQLSGAARTAFNQAAAKKSETQQWVRENVLDWDFGDLPDAVTVSGGARAIPALTVEGGKIALRLFESTDAAEIAHRKGVRALLLVKLNDRVTGLVKSAKGKLALALSGTPHTVDALAQALAERGVDETLLGDTLPRSSAAFQAALEKRGAFSQLTYQRMDEVAAWLTQAASLRRSIAAIAKPYPEACADAAQQLATLLGPGFITAIPAAQWPRLLTYLRALAVRLERLPLKPTKDTEAMNQLALRIGKLPKPFHPARWVLEEWRVQLFAQELKAVGAPNADKVDASLRG
ncbi:MAG: ATP-dependent RNA helicase HrpA [Stagnimonas sp.]|nr:ATP-dependent RNA helicase HrpA [Stagnimonas sp.]